MSRIVPPRAIKWFEGLLLASFGLFLIAVLLDYDILSARGAAGDPLLDGPYFDLVVETVITVALWYFVVRRASNSAKWVLVVLTAIGVIALPWTYSEFIEVSLRYALLNGMSSLLALGAAAMLFTPEAIIWFGRAVDPDVFS